MNSFIRDSAEYRPTTSTEIESQALSVEEDTVLSRQGTDTSTTAAGPSSSRSVRERLSKQLDDEYLVMDAIDRLDRISQSLSTLRHTENEFDLFGQHVTVQLKKLPYNTAIDMQCEIYIMLAEARQNAEI